MDRQNLLPRCTPEAFDENIRNAVDTLGSPDGGLMKGARIEIDTPLDNGRSVLEAMHKHWNMWVKD